MKNVYAINAGDVFWAASDVGWVVGHSYIVYAPLLAGATTVLYEGKPVGTPDAGAFWRVISEHKVNALFTAPTAFRAIKKEDPTAEHLKRYDVSSMHTLFLAGERLDPDTCTWASGVLGIPADTEGAICVRLPLPPGTLPTLWGDDDRYVAGYLSAFPGWYLTGDGGYKDSDGYVYVMGRTDDVINVAGHRLSTGSMEAVLASHPLVAAWRNWPRSCGAAGGLRWHWGTLRRTIRRGVPQCQGGSQSQPAKASSPVSTCPTISWCTSWVPS
jgi:propionyl-CoA synthetase